MKEETRRTISLIAGIIGLAVLIIMAFGYSNNLKVCQAKGWNITAPNTINGYATEDEYYVVAYRSTRFLEKSTECHEICHQLTWDDKQHFCQGKMRSLQ